MSAFSQGAGELFIILTQILRGSKCKQFQPFIDKKLCFHFGMEMGSKNFFFTEEDLTFSTKNIFLFL